MAESVIVSSKWCATEYYNLLLSSQTNFYRKKFQLKLNKKDIPLICWGKVIRLLENGLKLLLIQITTLLIFKRLSISLVWVSFPLEPWQVGHPSSSPFSQNRRSEQLHSRCPASHVASSFSLQPLPSVSVVSFRTYRVCKRALKTWVASSGCPISAPDHQLKAGSAQPNIYIYIYILTTSRAEVYRHYQPGCHVRAGSGEFCLSVRKFPTGVSIPEVTRVAVWQKMTGTQPFSCTGAALN
jgi:hypothetical protein